MKGFGLFLTGVALGAVAGVLLAPEKGVDSRERLKDYLRRKGLLPTEEEIDIILEEISESEPEVAKADSQASEKEEKK